MAGITSSTFGKRVIVVDTIAELQTQRGFANQRAILNTNTATDRGFGEFIWNNASTATVDGVLVVQTTGVTTGRWLRVVNSVTYHAAWWGIVGDGTNQSTKINAAITAIPAGSTLLFDKATTYNTTAQIAVNKAITIDGNGSTFNFTGGTAIKVWFISASNVTMQNMKIVGDILTYGGAVGRLLIANSVTGLSNSVFMTNITIRNCSLS